MNLDALALQTIRRLRSFVARAIGEHPARDALSLWLVPIRDLGKELNIDDIALYITPRSGQAYACSYVLGTKRWGDLNKELDSVDSSQALMSILAP